MFYAKVITLFKIVTIILFSQNIMCLADDFSIIADKITFNKKKGILEARGNVTIQLDNIKLQTDNLIYDESLEKIKIRSALLIKTRNGARVISDFAEINKSTRETIAINIKALIENRFQIAANKMFDNENKTVFTNAIGSPCDICIDQREPAWLLKSEKIIHDKNNRKLNFYNTWLEVFGVPLVFSPYLQTPEPGITRSTGLLTPTFLGSDILGTGLKQPFFIEINNSSDITMSVVKTSKINFLMETEYRRLFHKGNIKFDTAYLPTSEANKPEGFLKIIGEADTGRNSEIKWDATLISDTSFLGKYGYNDTDRFLNFISYEKFKNRSFLESSILYYTSLRDSSLIEPLALPNLDFQNHKYIKNTGIFMRENFSLLGLSRKDGKGYTRISADIQIEKNWKTESGLFLEGTGQIRSGFYKENNKSSTDDIFKLYPLVALQLNFPLIKVLNKKQEIIKPVAQIVYSSDLNPSSTPPGEDSSTTEFDNTTLFKLNKIPGMDKQETGLRLNAGLEYSSEIIEKYKYGLNVGQVFRNKNATDFISASGLNGFESDVLISGFFNLHNDLNISSKQVYSKNFSLKRSDTSLEMKKNRYTLDGNITNLISDPSEGTSSDLKELSFNFFSEFTKNWSGNLSLRRNLVKDETINASAGFNYKNDCIDIQMSISRRNTFSSILPRDSRIDLVINFGNIGSTFAETNVKSQCAL